MHLIRLSAVLVFMAAIPRYSQLDAQPLPRYSGTISVSEGRHALEKLGQGRFVFEGLVAIRTHRAQRVGLTFAALGATQWTFGGDDLNCPVDVDGGCKAGLPGYKYAALHAGTEFRAGNVTIALATGPALFRFASIRKVGGVINGETLFPTLPAHTAGGVHTRAEAAIYVKQTLGFVLSGSWRHIPRFRGAPFDINGIGIGIRLQ
ncbi:MAG: hypothetical protein H7Z40_03635 [Phycisphaerae bacterium]|nr:hypothetical protein [Gemmatimonadaceae bacterium]